MDNPEKEESRKNSLHPSDKPPPFPLDLVEKAASRDASQKRRAKSGGITLSISALIQALFTGKKGPQVAENPWKAASSSSAAAVGGVEKPLASGDEKHESAAPATEPAASGGVTLEEPAERAHERSLSEAAAPVEPEDGSETKKTGEPISIMEVFMAAKKGGRSPVKKSSTGMAMGDALDRQEKKSSVIEKMVDKNIAVETSGTRPEKREKRPLADIVSEVVARKEEQKAAPRAAKAAAKVGVEPKKAAPAAKAAPPKPQPQAGPRRAAASPVEVVVESLASGLINVLGSAVGGLIGAGKAAGRAVISGAKYVAGDTRSAAEKVKSAVKPGRGAKADKGQDPVAAAAKTAAQVTEKVASGLSSIAAGAIKVSGQVVSGVAAVAGYTVKGGVAIVSDTANALIKTAGGLLKIVLGPKKKKSKPA